MRKMAAGLLILAIIVSCIQYTAAGAIAASASATPAPTPKPAGNTTGSITGTVFDAIGNLVPDADVYLHDGRGVAMGLAASDGNGSYGFTELDPGNYAIVVQVDGYAWYKKFVVTAGFNNTSNIYIPDYVHYPMVTPRPPVNVNNSTPAGSKNTVSPTPKPAVSSAAGNGSTGTTNSTSINSTAGVTGPAANETFEGTSGSPIDDIIGGIVGFFLSLFGMSG